MSKNWEKTFDKCPACGENVPFFKGIVDELKKSDRVPEGWNFSLDMKQGVVYPPDRLQMLPIGALLPAFQFSTDICSECGCIYTIRLARKEAKTGIAPQKQMPQGRPDGIKIPPNFGDIRGN